MGSRKNNDVPEYDFGSDAEGFADDVRRAERDAASVHHLRRHRHDEEEHGVDDGRYDAFNQDNADEDENEEEYDDSEPLQKSNWLESRALVIGVVLIMALAIAGLSYFGYKILGGGSTEQRSASSEDMGLSDFGAAMAVQDPAQNNGSPQASGFDQSSGVAPQAVGFGAPLPVESQAEIQPAIIQRGEVAEQSLTQAPGSQSSMSGQPVAITEEERMYDQLIGNIGDVNVPLHAIRIDEGIVRSELDAKRFAQVEREIADIRVETQEVMALTTSIKASIAGMQAAIERGEKRTESIAADVKNLTATTLKQTSSIEEVRKIANAAVAKAAPPAKAKVAAAPARPAQPPARPAPQKVAAVQKQNVAPAAAATTVATASAVSAKSVEASNGFPPQCNGGVVSANWKLKGVNSLNAYIMRVQDRQGLMLEKGVSVPGFGSVIAFDASKRLVCTTAGVIGR